MDLWYISFPAINIFLGKKKEIDELNSLYLYVCSTGENAKKIPRIFFNTIINLYDDQ